MIDRAVDQAMNGALLTVEHLTMRFGGLVAIDDVSFQAADREISAIIGPNGAGKTTVFNCLTGFYKPTVGQLSLHSTHGDFLLERMEGFRIAQQARVARTFQNIRLFPKMTVLENLIVAQHNKLMRASGYTVGRPVRPWRVSARGEGGGRTRPLLARQDQPGQSRRRGRGKPALRRSTPARDCPSDVHGSRSSLP